MLATRTFRSRAQLPLRSNKCFGSCPRTTHQTFNISEEDLKKTRDSAKDGMGNHGVSCFMSDAEPDSDKV